VIHFSSALHSHSYSLANTAKNACTAIVLNNYT